MNIDEVIQNVEELAAQFGARTDVEFNKSYVRRNNTGTDALQDNGAYFGLISPEEEASGAFHDFSVAVFPNDQGKPWLVSLGIGINGFKNDYELATYPGLRRLFSKLVNENGFCKSDFSDIETNLPKEFTSRDDLQHLKNTIKKYAKVLPACQIINDPLSEEGKKTIAAFVAGYATLREWASNDAQRKAIDKALAPFINIWNVNDEDAIASLLEERKYVVLQGPPGTGKTRLAKSIGDILGAKPFFTQFHAETSYSDFIYGIRPNVDEQNLAYVEKPGIFTEALVHARESGEKTLLIIDEINRANLSNVLGPIFYLFEHKQDISNVEIEITPELKIPRMPNNLFVIATMNTADRSLAVVDFALRRRFAWYSLIPKPLEENFFLEDFNLFKRIFNWYANSNELSLQPGQGYFIASSEDEMKNRVRYELYPLVKEYIQEGLLRNAKEEFNDYFMNRIGLPLFE